MITPSAPSVAHITPHLVAGKKILVVDARFYSHISDMLFEGARLVLEKYGVTYERVFMPGALEIPAAIALAARQHRAEAFVALGCVVRGDTTHYEIVTEESARGLMTLAVDHGLCIGNGILTVENMEQAIVRADPKQLNKGGGAAEAALTLMSFRSSLRTSS